MTIKKWLFTILFSLKSFFYLSYPMLQLLCFIGVGLGIILSITSSNVKDSSHLITLMFILFSLFFVLLKHYYREMLVWSDSRSNNIVKLHR